MAYQSAVNSQITDFAAQGKGKTSGERSREGERKPVPGFPQGASRNSRLKKRAAQKRGKA